MTTLQGYTDGSYDYRHQYEIVDFRGPIPGFQIHKGSILHFLLQHPHGKNMASLISKTQIAGFYNDPQSCFTLFVPVAIGRSSAVAIDSDIDSYTAQQILLTHSLPFPACYSFLKSSRMMFLDTRLTGRKVLLENLTTDTSKMRPSATPTLERCSQILSQYKVGSSMVYFISNPLKLDGNPLSNNAI